MYSIDNQLKIDDFIFPYGKLDINNRWVKLAAIIPWNEFEETYSKQFINNGRPAKPLRIVLGSLIVKQKLNCSDRETVSAIAENPYLQYFIGLKEFQNSAPFGASSMVEFRKRISDDMIIEMNNTIFKDTTANKNKDDKDKHDDDGSNNSDKTNQGTIIVDATCTPADITYPQDLSLLNSAREKLEGYIDYLHAPSESKKPRTYRIKARKDFLNVSKARKKSCKKIRKAVRKQLNYIARDIAYVENFIGNGKKLNSRQIEEHYNRLKALVNDDNL